MNWTEASFGQWLLHTAFGGGLLLLLGWLAMLWTRQPARRQRLGEMGLAGALLVAILSVAPAWLIVRVPSSRPLSATAEPLASPSAAGTLPPEESQDDALVYLPLPGETLDTSDAMKDATAIALQGHPAEMTVNSLLRALPWASMLAAAYGLGASFILARWLLGYLALWHILRTAEAAPPRVARLFASMTTEPRRPRLTVTHRLRVPLSCGLLRPTVVLPASLCDAPGPELRWIFAHELTHLERRDPWTCLLFALGQALFFYLPWFWALRRQVQLCQEFVADARAAGQAEQPADYAQFLLSLTSAPLAPACASGVSGHTSDLFRRIAMLLQNPYTVERRCPRLWSLVTAGGLLSMAVLIAGVGLRAEAAAPGADRSALSAPDDAKKDEPKKDQPKQEKKDTPKKEESDEPKKEKKRILGGDFELPDIEELLKNLPQNIDPEKLAEIRKQMEQMRTKMRERMQELRQNMPEGIQGRFPFRAGRPILSPGRLGVRVDRPSAALADQLDLPRGQGLVVLDVLPDSPAAKAGLRPHDILLQFAGKAVSSDHAEFSEMVRQAKSDTPIDLVVKRKGKDETIKGMTLPDVKNDPRQRRQGPGGIREFGPAGQSPGVNGVFQFPAPSNLL